LGARIDRFAALALALVVLVFVVDLMLPLGVAAAVPYTFAVLLALAAKPPWFGPAVAGACLVLTFAKLELVPERGTTEMWKVLANRGLAAFAITMTTLLGLLRRRAESAVRAREAELARAARLAVAGELATALAHELNQPLAAVYLQADLAVRMGGASPELTAALEEIAMQARRAAQLVRAMREMVRRDPAARGPVSMNDVVQAVARLLEWKARRAGATVTVRPAEPLPLTYGEPVRLEQVVFNLVQNAIESVAERAAGPRAVEVSTATDGEWVLVRVSDTGIGLTDAERVFDQFYTTKADGMGMGLAIARSAAEAHGGKLTARALDDGAAFVLALPAYREERP
jgi:C4-dicarboxylate-specific signal transduction histidine kinase